MVTREEFEYKLTSYAASSGVQLQTVVDTYVNDTINKMNVFYNLIPKKQGIGGSIVWESYKGFFTEAGQSSENPAVISGDLTPDQFTMGYKIQQATAEVTDYYETLFQNNPNHIGQAASLFAEKVNKATEAIMAKPYVDTNTKYGLNGQLFRDGTAVVNLGASGLLYWLDDSSNTLSGPTTVAGKTRSSYTQLCATVDTATEALSEAKLRSTFATLETAGADYRKFMIVTTPTILANWRNRQQSAQHYVNTTELKVGFSKTMVPTFDEVPMYADKDCPSGDAFVLDMGTWEYHVLKDFFYEDLAKTGATKKGFIRQYGNLICRASNFNAVLTNKS
jgi:hypothetical protein